MSSKQDLVLKDKNQIINLKQTSNCSVCKSKTCLLLDANLS